MKDRDTGENFTCICIVQTVPLHKFHSAGSRLIKNMICELKNACLCDILYKLHSRESPAGRDYADTWN